MIINKPPERMKRLKRRIGGVCECTDYAVETRLTKDSNQTIKVEAILNKLFLSPMKLPEKILK